MSRPTDNAAAASAEPAPRASGASVGPALSAPPGVAPPAPTPSGGSRTKFVLIRSGCAVVGAVLLTAAAAKVARPAGFLLEVQSLPLVDGRGPSTALAAFVLLAEIGLGLALLLGWRIRSSAGCAAGLLAAFLTVLTFRAAGGEADSCTCFGNWWIRSLPAALTMDAGLLAAAIACAVAIGPAQPEPPRWKTWLVTAGSAIAMPAAAALFVFTVPPEPIQAGLDLRRLELPEPLRLYQGEHLLVILDTDCSWCRGQWKEIVALHHAGRDGRIPPVSFGVYGGQDVLDTPLKIEQFRTEMKPPPTMELVPLLSETTVMRAAATRTPVILLLRAGRVRTVWARFVPTVDDLRAEWKALPGSAAD